MAQKNVEFVMTPGEVHWVGDGFRVHNFIPSRFHLERERMDPFILLDYNSEYEFAPAPKPMGVGVHPHRGFETVTIAYQGEVSHRDSHGGGGTIGTGDVQWMTAGSGVMHEEMHSEKFAKEGGLFEMVQLWVNLPTKDKMTAPKYQAIKAENIPVVALPNNAGSVRVIAGELLNVKGPADTFSSINMWDTTMNANAAYMFSVPASHNVIILVLDGTIQVGGNAIARRGELVTFERGAADVLIESNNTAKLLILTGEPLNEPVVGYGPFVMNSREEILQAIHDVQSGKFGNLT